MNPQEINAMIYHSITDYLIAKNNYEQASARITPDGKMFVLVNDKWFSMNEYSQHNTKPEYQPFPKINPDKQNISSGYISTKTK